MGQLNASTSLCRMAVSSVLFVNAAGGRLQLDS